MQLSHGAYSDPYGLGWGMQTKLYEPIGQPSTVDQLVDTVASQVFGTALAGNQRNEFVN